MPFGCCSSNAASVAGLAPTAESLEEVLEDPVKDLEEVPDKEPVEDAPKPSELAGSTPPPATAPSAEEGVPPEPQPETAALPSPSPTVQPDPVEETEVAVGIGETPSLCG